MEAVSLVFGRQPFLIATRMNRKIFVSMLLSVFFSASACGDDKGDPVSSTNISVSSSEFTFDGNEGTQTLKVTASQEWGCVTEEEWIKVDPSSSLQLSTDINISVSKNDETEPREGIVTFKCGAARAYLAVKQAAGDGVVDPNAITCSIPGYKLVWNDEFEQSSADLDNSVWRHEVQGDHWVNNELQNYVNTVSPGGSRVTEVHDGVLSINCFKESGKIYSGRVYAKDNIGWKYGYMEAKIKLPKGKGTWPAFWMMPVTVDWANEGWPLCGEIDIMEEVGYHPNFVSSSLHAKGHYHANGTQITKEVKCAGAEGEYHVYGMEWTAKYIQFYVDGKETLYYENDGTGVINWPYSKPYYIILNLAWGGDWGGSQGVDESALPVTMDVDYVRVFQKK